MEDYSIERPKKALRKALGLGLALLVVAAVVTGIYFYTKVHKAASSESRPVNFQVARGQNTRQIADNLVNQKIINNKTVFIIYSKFRGTGNKIQAGDYQLNANMTIAEIVDSLTTGKVVESNRTVTIIEGLTNKQIGKQLASKKITSSDADFEKVLADTEFNFKFKTAAEKFKYQGFMFPDTYTLSKDGGVDELIKKMLKNFENKMTDRMISDINSSERSLSDVLVLASIVEKEVGRNKENLTDQDLETMQKERKLVASVFYNRLSIGMALESDATVNYITGKADRSVTIEDTKIKSPYNTYQNRGLPPGPISNPGLDSIMAAIYPTESDYLFFLNSPDGTAYFGKTLDEHNQNRAKYLR